MGTFYFIIVFIAVLAFYAYANMELKRDYVICVTYRFLDNNGDRKDSRKLHSRESVVGVVEYKL